MLIDRTNLWTMIVCVGLCLCVSCGDDDESPVETDTTRPTVISTIPVANETGVAVDTTIQVTFSEWIKSSSVTDTCLVFNGGVTGTAVCSANAVTFTPDADLERTFNYAVTLENSITDLAGNALAEDYTWFFSTEGGLIPIPSLLGEYVGIYVYRTGHGTVSEETFEYPIAWRFSDQNYWVWNFDDQVNDICEPSGEYILTDSVELIQREEGCAGAVTDPSINPTGIFSLRQPSDSVIMTQVIGTIFKEIRLAPPE